MLKVVLLNPPSSNKYLRDQYCTSLSKAEYYWHPIDLLIQSGILSREHDVNVIDAQVDSILPSECTELLLEIKPDIILFVTGFLSMKQDLDYIKQISRLIDSKFIATGGYLLYDCKKHLEENPFIDAILLDYTSDSLLEYLNGNNELYDICVKYGGQIIEYPRRKNDEISYPPPRYDLFALNTYKMPYSKKRLFASVATSYGCPYKCNFCIARKIPFKQRNLQNVFLELDVLNKLNIKELFFRDFTFGTNYEYTVKLCEYLKRNGFSWSASSRVDILDDNLLSIMKASGCHTLNFGVESPKDVQLRNIEKNIVVKDVIKTFSRCKKIGIKTLAHYIIGLPGDKLSDISNLIDFSVKLKSDYASYNIAIPLPGSGIENYRGSDLSYDELVRLKNKAYKSFYFNVNYIFRYIRNLTRPSDLTCAVKNCVAFLRKNFR